MKDMKSETGGIQLLLARLAELNIKVWADGEQLHINAPAGVLNEELKQALRQHKPALIASLREAKRSDIKMEWPRLAHDEQNRYEPFPLSDVQHAYWLGRSKGIEFGNVATHFYYELDCENLDLRRFNDALCRLIDRHDMMRAVVNDDGTQKVLAQVPRYEIPVLDVSHLPPDEQEAKILAIRAEASHQMLPADKWPLFDIRAVRLSEIKTHLYFSWDFINLDAWSVYAICREWNALYADPDAVLPPVTICYRDYVLAERTLRDSALYQRDRDYWGKRLDSLPEAPILPIRPIQQTDKRHTFTRRRFRLDNARWRQLQGRARSLGITSSSILLAAFSEVLAYWSKQPHFTLNLTFFNRLPMHPDVYRLVGDFTSLILLEVDLRQRNKFKDRATAIQRQFLQDFEHRLVSGVEVMREWSKKRGYALQAVMPVVFTSCLVLNSEEGDDAGLLESFGKMTYGISQTPQVFLDNQIMEDEQGLVLNWDAVEEVFEQGTLDAMFMCYCDFIVALSASDEPWEACYPLRLPADQLQQRTLVNGTAAEISAECLHEGFLNYAAINPDAIALQTSERQMTYGELLARSVAAAERLDRLEVGIGEPVAVLIEKSWEQIVAVMAILIAGGAYIPIDPDLPSARRRQLLEQSGCRVVLIKPDTALKPELGEDIAAVEIEQKLPQRVATVAPPVKQRSADLAYVIFTSGSTGVPKGVMIDHRGAVNTLVHVNRLFNVSAGDRVLAVSSLSFDLSVYDIFGVLAVGGCVVIPDARLSADPEHWLQLIERYGVTVWNSAPPLMMMLLSNMEGFQYAPIPDIRLVLLSGDWIPLNVKSKLESYLPNAHLISLGGATEASVWSIYYPVERIEPHWKSIPYGRPLPNQTMHVLNSHLKPCPVNVTGQIHIGGIGVALGYLNDEEKTRRHFIVHPDTGERLYYTGDLGRYMPDGDIEFLGREDSQIKLRGHRIELGEIESLLNQYPGVGRAVVGVIDHGGNRQLAAYIVGDDTASRSNFYRQEAAHEGCTEQAWNTAVERGEACQQHYLQEHSIELSRFATFWRYLEQYCVQTMHETLWQLAGGGRFSVAGLLADRNIKPAYEALVRQWLVVLRNEGLLERLEDDLYRFASKPVNSALAREFRASIKELGDGAGPLAEYFQECLNNQRALLSGEIEPVELLFPQGDNDWSRAESLYQTNPVSMLHNRVIAEVLAGLVSSWPEKRPVRVLEVGAGTGGATGELLAILPPERTTYYYTDVTGFFMNKARRKFAAYDFVRYQTYDINKDPVPQGYERHSFDFVVAINVLHDAENLNHALSSLKSMLAPGGKLLALEGTRNTPIQMVTVGYLEGFGNYRDERLQSNLPLLSPAEWREFFRRAGYGQTAAFPESGAATQAMVQHVLVAESPRSVAVFQPDVLREYLADHLPEYMVPQYYSIVDQLPVTANGKIDYKFLTAQAGLHIVRSEEAVQPDNDVESRLLSIWKSILGSDNLGVITNFFDAGGDSLLLVQMRSRIQAEFGVNVSTTVLFEYPTIRALAGYIDSGATSASRAESLTGSEARGSKQRAALMRRRARQTEEKICVDE